MTPLLYRPLKQPAYRQHGTRRHRVMTKRKLVRSIYLDAGRKEPLRNSMFDLKYVKGWPVCG